MTGIEVPVWARPAYYRRTHGCILVFDITNILSFTRLEIHLLWITQYAPAHNSVILIENKNDLSHIREISFEEADAFAKANGIVYIETSALTGYGREEMLNILISNIQNKLAEIENLDTKHIQLQQKGILYKCDCF